MSHKAERKAYPVQTNETSIKLQKIKAGWSIVYTEGSQGMISKQKYCISWSVDRFVLQYNEDPDEMPHSAPF